MAGVSDIKLLTLWLVLLFLFISITPSDCFRERMRIPVYTSNSTDSGSSKISVTIAAILPQTSFDIFKRGYTRSLEDTAKLVNRNKNFKFQFTSSYVLKTEVVTMALAASPLTVLETLCDKVLPLKPSAIMYMTNSPVYGTNAASAQYMLQLTGYLGIPVIAWNVDNIGLEQIQRVSDSRILQLAPTVEHQVQVMLSIMRRYSWHTFSVVTSRIGGHEDFIRAIRDLTQRGLFPDFK